MIRLAKLLTSTPFMSAAEMLEKFPALKAEVTAQISASVTFDEARCQVRALLFGAGLALYGSQDRGDYSYSPEEKAFFSSLGDVSRALAEASPFGVDLLAPWSDEPMPGDRKAMLSFMNDAMRRYLMVRHWAIEDLRRSSCDAASLARAEAMFAGAVLARGHARSSETALSLVFLRRFVINEARKQPAQLHTR